MIVLVFFLKNLESPFNEESTLAYQIKNLFCYFVVLFTYSDNYSFYNLESMMNFYLTCLLFFNRELPLMQTLLNMRNAI